MEVFLVGGFGAVYENRVGGGGIAGVEAGIIIVVAVNLRRSALVVYIMPRSHARDIVELVARGWSRQVGELRGMYRSAVEC